MLDGPNGEPKENRQQILDAMSAEEKRHALGNEAADRLAKLVNEEADLNAMPLYWRKTPRTNTDSRRSLK